MKKSTFIFLFATSALHLFAQVEVVSGGNVGVGTTSPSAKFHVVDLTGSTPVEVEGTNASAFFTLNPDQVVYLRSRDAASSGATTKNSVQLAMRGWYWNGSSSTSADTALQTVVSGNNQYRLAFKTNWTERMAINQSGNVGIGTTAPQEKLEVAGNILLNPADKQIKIYANTDGVDSIVFARSDNSHQSSIATTAFGKSILLKVGGSEIVRFRNDGNVGIGTTTPGYKLEVAGNVRATSFIADTNTYADFVFAPGYRLPLLSEVEAHINERGHLPGIPSEAEARAHGIDLAALQVKLLQKVEELTLHAIAQEKEIKALRRELHAQKNP